MKVSFINYIKDAKLRDNVFDLDNTSSFILFFGSGFFIDYNKLFEILV
jgi:hypothetical protein